MAAHHGKLDQVLDQASGSSSDSSSEFDFSRPQDTSVSQLNRALGISSTLRRVRTEANREDISSSGEHQLETSLSKVQSRQLEQIVLIPRAQDGSAIAEPQKSSTPRKRWRLASKGNAAANSSDQLSPIKEKRRLRSDTRENFLDETCAETSLHSPIAVIPEAATSEKTEQEVTAATNLKNMKQK